MQVLIAGASGLVGGRLLDLLLARPDVTEVVAVGRSVLAREHGKLRSVVVDLAAPGDLPPAQELYIALGTTIRKAKSEAGFRMVDFDYVTAVARAARRAGVQKVGLVSSLGASANSSMFYSRVKGEAEDVLRELGFQNLVIARPSILDGERSESRPGERVGIAVGKALAFAMVGGLRKYRPIAPAVVARALCGAVAEAPSDQRITILESDALAARGQA